MAWLKSRAALQRCKVKQEQRKAAVADAKNALTDAANEKTPFAADTELPNMSARELCAALAERRFTARHAVGVMSTAALASHATLNCLTEICVKEALDDASRLDDAIVKGGPVGPLHGLPVSIKDNIVMRGYDCSMGYSCKTQQPCDEDATIVQCLRKAGAIPYVKTNVPQTLMSYESDNPVFGCTLNPHNHDVGPGGSSGGEGALIASGGSVLGVGSDVGGSLRSPATLCGIYSLKPSTTRLPSRGMIGGDDYVTLIKATVGPLARDVDGLELFMSAVLDQKPWEIDTECVPMPWQPWTPPEKLCIGYFTFNKYYPVSPANQRAVTETVEKLRAAGHDVVPFDVPSAEEACVIFYNLSGADGCRSMMDSIQGDPLCPPVAATAQLASIPDFLRGFAGWLMRTFMNAPNMAKLVETSTRKSAYECRQLITRRNNYTQHFFEAARASALKQCGRPFDAIVGPAFGVPAIPHGKGNDVIATCSYLALQNIMDVPAGILPATKVDRALDAHTPDVSWAGKDHPIEFGEQMMRKYYDVDALHGLPVGVQVFSERLQEERVVGCMRIIDACIQAADA